MWEAHYAPTDSGDGSKASWMEGALPYPHVFCVLNPAHLVLETDRAATLNWDALGLGAPTIETSYAPGGPAVLTVSWPDRLPPV